MENPDFQRRLQENIRTKIETARNNAIARTRLEELQREILILGKRDDIESFRREDEIEREILNSSAIAKDITEFRELLRQIGVEYSLNGEFVHDTLAHENAHANVAEVTGHEWVGYIALFLKNSEGQVDGIQPAFFLKNNRTWGKAETLMKRLAVTKAPKLYGNSLTDSDEGDIQRDEKRLKELEVTHSEEIKRVSRELGLNL